MNLYIYDTVEGGRLAWVPGASIVPRLGEKLCMPSGSLYEVDNVVYEINGSPDVARMGGAVNVFVSRCKDI